MLPDEAVHGLFAGVIWREYIDDAHVVKLPAGVEITAGYKLISQSAADLT